MLWLACGALCGSMLVGALAGGCTSAEGAVLFGPFVSLELVSSPDDDLFLSLGTEGQLSLRVEGISASGARTTLPVRSWSVEPESLARFRAPGLLVSQGPGGGVVAISATVEMRPGVTVDVRRDITVRAWAYDVVELSDAYVSILDTPAELDVIETPRIVHPFAGARIPGDAPSIAVRWEGGDPGDLDIVYALRAAPDGEGGYRAAYLGARWHGDGDTGGLDIEAPFIRTLLETDRDLPLFLSMASIDGATRRYTTSEWIGVELTTGSFVGGIAYQESEGRVLFVDWATSRRSSLIPSIEPREGDRCIGCHAFSTDAYVFAASLYDDHQGALAYTFEDLTRDPAPLRFPLAGARLAFPALAGEPTHRRMLAVVDDALQHFDVTDLEAVVPLVSPGLPAAATHPAFARDLSRAAWVARDDGDAIRFASSTLAITAIDGDDFDAPIVEIAGASLAAMPEGGAAIAHPSFSPDGSLVAFTHGPRSTLGYGDGPSPQALYVVAADGSGAPIRLRWASLPTAIGASAGWPVFLPWTSELPGIDGGEPRALAWLAFASRMPFADVPSGQRQLWITAIDLAAARRGEDPGWPPFWMPGQDPATSNIVAQFLAWACFDDGAPCTIGDQCCSGVCELRPEVFSSACAAAEPPAE
jgi:hypothetical protein